MPRSANKSSISRKLRVTRLHGDRIACVYSQPLEGFFDGLFNV
jgi:hypothetical protein